MAILQPLKMRFRDPRLRLATAIVALALTFAASLAAVALAAQAGPPVHSAANAKLSQTVLVDAQGRTLYALSPETSHHLLCKSEECLHFWPPLTVRTRAVKLKTGAGVHGRLAILARSHGVLQVTLNGLPLYRFSGDHAEGEANGQHIHSFGGVWHALVIGHPPASAPSTPATGTPAPPSMSGTPAAPMTPAPTTSPPPTTTAPSSPAPPTTPPVQEPPPYVY